MQNTIQASNNALHIMRISAASPANGDGILLPLKHLQNDLGGNVARVDFWLGPDKPPRVISVYTDGAAHSSEESQSVNLCYRHVQDVLDYPVLAFALQCLGSSCELQMVPVIEQERSAEIDGLIESSKKHGRKI